MLPTNTFFIFFNITFIVIIIIFYFINFWRLKIYINPSIRGRGKDGYRLFFEPSWSLLTYNRRSLITYNRRINFRKYLMK